jgi:hypothetical protein
MEVDWSANLDGVKRLVQEPPPSTLQEEGVPAPVPPPAANARGAVGGGETAKGPDRVTTADPYLRAAAYLKRIKAAQIDNIKNKMAKDMLAHNTIRSHNVSESTAYMMVGDGSHVGATLDGMVDVGDPRMLVASLNLDLKTKRIITTS